MPTSAAFESLMNRLLSLFAFLALSCGHIHAVERARPNVVFILADDLGWRDIGCFGSTFHHSQAVSIAGFSAS